MDPYDIEVEVGFLNQWEISELKLTKLLNFEVIWEFGHVTTLNINNQSTV